MISSSMVRTVSEDLHPPRGHAPRHLMALIDMAALPAQTRTKLTSQFGDRLHPLLQDPAFAVLQPLGAMLLAALTADFRGHDSLLNRLHSYDSSVVSAWITSTLPPAALAQHFAQATFATGLAGERYLLRYYDPRVMPILHRQAAEAWRQWFFAPVVSWWCPRATTEQEQWHRLPGLALDRPPRTVPPLILHEPLERALGNDPLSHQLVQSLSQQTPSLFNSDCHGVRVAQVEALLKTARAGGLTDQENLADYVLLGLQHSLARLANDRRWQAAVQQAASGRGRLTRLYLGTPQPHTPTRS